MGDLEMTLNWENYAREGSKDSLKKFNENLHKKYADNFGAERIESFKGPSLTELPTNCLNILKRDLEQCISEDTTNDQFERTGIIVEILSIAIRYPFRFAQIYYNTII
ncbi:unnamed protein product [Calicophoron daubneyi]|uniref:Uncharacterized protein n=1 Tax=Calicophoron daubneyi TaxID=300641 RepID=A0AAV2TI85_CALDB